MNTRMPAWKLVVQSLAIAVATAMLAWTALIKVVFSEFVDESNGPSLEIPGPPDKYEQALIDSPFDVDVTRSMSVTAQVMPDRSAVITERIVQVFSKDSRGIYRTIPTEDQLGDHAVTELVVATSEGTPDALFVEDITWYGPEGSGTSGSGISVRIGEEDVYITGPHAYQLTYRLENVVQIDGDVATVRLDAITDWQQDVNRLDYTVIGPAAPTSSTCYLGAFGAETACVRGATTDSGGTFLAPAEGLPARDGFTVEYTFPASAFDPVPTVTDRSHSQWPVPVALGLMLVGLAASFAIAERRRIRDIANAIAGIDSTFSGPMSVDLEGRRQSTDSPFPPPSASSALAVSAAPPLEFVPPVNLDPACLLRMHDGFHADIRRMVAATLVDLAADGVIGLEKSGKDWLISRIPQPPRNVKSYELTLLTALLGDADQAKLSDRKDEIAGALEMYFVQIDNYLAELGLMSPEFPAQISHGNGGTVISVAKIVVAGVLWVVTSAVFAGIASVIASVSNMREFAVPAIGGVLGLVFVVAGWITSNNTQAHLTPRGRGTSYRARGFARFMNDSEAIHARAAERMGVLREYMGYAVAFDAVTTWTKAMPDSVRAEMPFLADPVALGWLWTAPVLTSSSRIAFAPTSSGGGGFSFGGGGFSGGGSGGGGGGSW